MPFSKAAALSGGLSGFMRSRKARKERQRLEEDKNNERYESFLVEMLGRQDLKPEGQQVVAAMARDWFGQDADSPINPMDALSQAYGTLYEQTGGETKALPSPPDVGGGTTSGPLSITSPRESPYFHSPEDLARIKREQQIEAARAAEEARIDTRLQYLNQPGLDPRLQQHGKFTAITGQSAPGLRVAPPEDLVQTVGPDGEPIYTPQSQAAGKQAYIKRSGAMTPLQTRAQRFEALGDPPDVALRKAAEAMQVEDELQRRRTESLIQSTKALTQSRAEPETETPQEEQKRLLSVQKLVTAYIQAHLKVAAPDGIGDGQLQMPVEEAEALADRLGEEAATKLGYDPVDLERRLRELGSGQLRGGGQAGTASQGIWPPPE
jgi:antitoxin component HigA of HigAB toxin-antitoxin module